MTRLQIPGWESLYSKILFLFMNICKQTLSCCAVPSRLVLQMYELFEDKWVLWASLNKVLLMYHISDFCRKHLHASLMLMLTAVCHLMNLFYIFATGCNARWSVLKYLLYLHLAKHSTKSTSSCWLYFVCCFMSHFTVTQEILFCAKTSATYWCQWDQWQKLG